MSKILVAYFSAGGTTAQLAERLAREIGADLFAIEPETPYTQADLDWTDSKSRSTLEMNDPACRPAIRGTVADMADYETVFVGFPIWWYREPSIIDSFMEAYDFGGKVVVPFATSGMSPLGEAGDNIQKLAPGARVVDGRRFDARTASDKLVMWAKEWL